MIKKTNKNQVTKNPVLRIKPKHSDFYKNLGDGNIHTGLDMAMRIIMNLKYNKQKLIEKDLERLMDHIHMFYPELYESNISISNIPAYILNGLNNRGACNVNILKDNGDKK